MAELNLKQIVDKLNTEFTGDTRKLVFWYDEKGEFAEDIDGIELANAKVYITGKSNKSIAGSPPRIAFKVDDRSPSAIICSVPPAVSE